VALIAYALRAFVSAMFFVVSVDPTRPDGRAAATFTEVALHTLDGDRVAIGTIVRGFAAMKLGAFFIQPVLTQDMVDPLAMTIVTCLGAQSVLAFDLMTRIADVYMGCKIGMTVLSMDPIGSTGCLAAIRAEMTVKTAGDIPPAGQRDTMAQPAGFVSILDCFFAMEVAGFPKLGVVPGLFVNRPRVR